MDPEPIDPKTIDWSRELAAGDRRGTGESAGRGRVLLLTFAALAACVVGIIALVSGCQRRERLAELRSDQLRYRQEIADRKAELEPWERERGSVEKTVGFYGLLGTEKADEVMRQGLAGYFDGRYVNDPAGRERARVTEEPLALAQTKKLAKAWGELCLAETMLRATERRIAALGEKP